MKPLLLFFIALLSLPLFSQTVDEQTARERAAAFLKGRKSRSCDVAELSTLTANRAGYLLADKEGRYVWTAADDRLPQILGYGEGAVGRAPAAAESFLLRYETALLAVGSVWTPPSYDGPVIPPLLTMTRHQRAPYNNYCPYYLKADSTLSEERCVVGCVATALEEILTYHRRMVTLCDTLHGWATKHYVIPDVLPGETVDTRLIRDNYNNPDSYTAEEADAVARLSYICGVAAQMRWGLSESGARVSALEEPLKRAFGLGFVHYADSYKYRPDDWLRMLRGEIQCGRPVLYAGYAMRMNGHAFVLDGLDEEGRFHVNWGVDGDYDGYFFLDLLNSNEPAGHETPSGQYEGYFANQEALLLHPDEVDVALPDTLTRTGLELRVDSVKFDVEASQERYTPLRLYLTNTSDQPLTTPLELFTNAPTDTAMYEQADYIALSGITLAPSESRELTLYGVFLETGNRILRITPDEKNIIYEQPIRVAQRRHARLTFAQPQLSFPALGELRLCQTISNAEDAGRAGNRVLYELYEYASDDTYRRMGHVDFCMLQCGETETDTITFRHLRPGSNCTLYVRYNWTPQHELHFTVPTDPTAINPTTVEGTAEWYDLSGRRVAKPLRPGIYINRGRKVLVQ